MNFFFLPKFLLDPFLEIEIGIGRGVKLYHDTISKIEIIILVQMVLFRHGKAVKKKKKKNLFFTFFFFYR